MADLKSVECQGTVMPMVFKDADDWMTQASNVVQACFICRTRDKSSPSGRKLQSCTELLDHLWTGHK
jgi:hypothetical protein